MSSQQAYSNQVRDLTQGSILRQLFGLAMPLMAMSFIQMAYNLVDLAWIGRLGSQSVAAVGTVGLFMWMMNSTALISKIGAEISIGQSVGAKRLDKASIYASHTTTIALLLGLFFSALFFLFPQFFVSIYQLDEAVSTEATRFMRFSAFGLPFMFMVLNFSGVYVGSGRSDIPFYFNAVGLVLNMILDPIAIFALQLGSVGAALATVFSQMVVCVLFVWHLKKYGLLHGFRFFITLKSSYVRKVLSLGLPIAAMNVFFAFINMNLVRVAFMYGGHLGVTSQTTGGQIEGLTWNTSVGFATALGSFVAQNYAARKLDRVKRAFATTLSVMTVYGGAVTAAFMLFGVPIFYLFVPEKAASIAGGEYLFVLGVSQLFMMLELTTEGMFNGFGRTTPPAIVSIIFNFLRIPLAYLLASQMGIVGVWWAITTSSVLKGIFLFVWYQFLHRKIKNQVQEGVS